MKMTIINMKESFILLLIFYFYLINVENIITAYKIR